MTHAAESASWQVGILWMLKLDEGAVRVPPTPLVAVTFQCVGPEAARSLAQAIGRNDTREVLQRFAVGKRCYVGKVDSTIATYGWVTFDEEHIGELGLSIRMQDHEVYIWDCATLPPYRGLRL